MAISLDMNDVIISIGGVDRIEVYGDINMTDAQLQAHITNEVIMLPGQPLPTVAAVKAQKAALGL